MADTRLSIKNTQISYIFETMSYQDEQENFHRAKEWINKIGGKISSFSLDKGEEFLGKSKTVKFIPFCENLLPSDVNIYCYNTEQILKILPTTTSSTNQTHTDRINLLEKFKKAIENSSELIIQLEIAKRNILRRDTVNGITSLTSYLNQNAYYGFMEQSDVGKTRTILAIIPDQAFLGMFGMVLGPALALGYSVILQTSLDISIIAALLTEIAITVGYPRDQIKIIPGKDVDLNKIMLDDNITMIANFENMTLGRFKDIEYPINKKVISFNYAGTTPMIVFETADLHSVCYQLRDAVWGHRGILPWRVDTVLVQESILQPFLAALKPVLARIITGHALRKNVDVTFPYTAEGGLEFTALAALITEAQAQGIDVLRANDKHGNSVVEPTVFVGQKVRGNNVIVENVLPGCEATLTVLAFRTTAEAIALANNTSQGLAASVWTENMNQVNEVTKQLQVANIWINSHGIFDASVAIGPQKASGAGHFGGIQGIQEYLFNNIVPNECLIEPVSDSITDIHNICMAAKVAHVSWKKINLTNRSFKIINIYKIFLEMNKDKSDKKRNEAIEKWLTAIDKSINLPSTDRKISTLNGNNDIHIYYEPLGTIALPITKLDNYELGLIIAALLTGNALILFNIRSISPEDKSLLTLFVNNMPATLVQTLYNFNNMKTLLLENDVYIFGCSSSATIRAKYNNKVSNSVIEFGNVMDTFLKKKYVWFNV